MTIVLFDDASREGLLPLTFTKPVAALRVGILTIAEKWQRWLKADYSFLTAPYLREKFPVQISPMTIFINGSVCPDEVLLEAINQLAEGQSLRCAGSLIAVKLNESAAAEFNYLPGAGYEVVEYPHPVVKIIFPENIFMFNDSELRKDYQLITAGRTSAALNSTNTLLGEDIFIEEGVEADCSTFNSKSGPIYLGRNSQVWEGCHIRGSFALCNDSQVKMGAKTYGATTVGPFSRVGGEINNSVISGYSSKGHEGFLGNSVLGEWCNIGADSNNSNLKNNYAEVRLWDYQKENFRRTGLQFCGLIMADHAKCGINTMFNTGTVVGVSANVFGAGFPRNFIPDFAWGGPQGLDVYALSKMFETAKMVCERRNVSFSDIDKKIMEEVFNLTMKHRRF
jgi:UDP-N-acetylglucosamine diphosphorylase/glucosamine-1-phosphate N-acetyltransferase